jgi:hypothetical protein
MEWGTSTQTDITGTVFWCCVVLLHGMYYCIGTVREYGLYCTVQYC